MVPPAPSPLRRRIIFRGQMGGPPKRKSSHPLPSLEQQEGSSMSKPQDRTVSRRPDGTWENKRNDASRAREASIARRREAQDAAREMLKTQGGES